MTLVITRKDINNEIILLRQFVRQARICTINKLVREAKRLRANRGNEKQLEKNRNKADKLLREVVASKRIKDDEISKFGIINLKSLQDTIQKPRFDDKTRAMAKVARHKTLNIKLIEFNEKFPNCKEYILCGQKKRLQNKKRVSPTNETSTGTPKCLLNDENITKDTEFIENVKDIGNARDLFIDPSNCVIQQENIKANEKRDVPTEASLWYKQEKHGSNKQQSKENGSESTNAWKTCNIDNTRESKSVVKVISKEATVKRFTDILQETSTEDINNTSTENNDKQSLNELMDTWRKVDDFFLNSDEVMSDPNATTSVEERKVNKMLFVDNNTFKILSTENKGGKFYSNETSTDGKNRKRQKIVDKGVSRVSRVSQSSIEASNNEHSKQNRKIVKMKGKSTQGNVTVASAVQNEKLHPSWVARKKQQEIMKQGFQGKKIRFDEN